MVVAPPGPKLLPEHPFLRVKESAVISPGREEQSACPTDHLFAFGQEGLPAWKRPERLGSVDLDRGDKVGFG